MSRKCCFIGAVLLVGLLGAALPVRAAEQDKYFLDDAEFVFRANLKQVIASPAFAKHYKPQLETLLQLEPVQMALKNSGFDPFKDLEGLTVVVGGVPKNDGDDPRAIRGPDVLILVEGRFDAARLKAKAEEIGNTVPNFKTYPVGDTTVYDFAGQGPPGTGVVCAQLDKTTLAFSPKKSLIEDALEKASGKKKSELKSKALQAMLQKRDPKQSVEIFATSGLPFGGSGSSVNGNFKFEYKTLGDQGIESIWGGATIADEVKAQAKIICKDAEDAKKISVLIEQGLSEAIKHIQQEAEKIKELAPVAEALNAVKADTQDKTITLNAQFNANAVVALLKSFFLLRATESRAVPAADK